ncbi:MAG: T9SS type A sorting domain-containing protein [Williamsia sp.]|nr:T9SS type A sorting domain-containing protein [Williamsia sp.]
MKTIFTSLAMLFCASLFAQPGALDPGFGSNGVYKAPDTTMGKYGDISAVKLLPDGKMIIAGSSNFGRAYAFLDLYIARLNANGTLDSSFGTAGRTVVDFATDSDNLHISDDIAANLSLQTDGKIVVSCTVKLYPQGSGNGSDIGVVRLNADGSFDNSFNGTGKKRINITTAANPYLDGENCSGVAIRSNGKIVLGGYTFNQAPKTFQSDIDALLIQLNGNGSFDNTFGSNGVQVFTKRGTDEYINSIALQSDNKLVLAGNTGTANVTTANNILLIRTLPSGALDKTFNSVGYTTTDIQNKSADFGTDVTLQTDGKIVVGAYINPGEGAVQNFLLRYNANGKPDATFGTKGKAFIDSSSTFFYTTTSLSLTTDGKIVQTTSRFSVYRVNTNGSRDASFGTNGKVSLYADPYKTWQCFASAVQPDNKIVAVGLDQFSLGRNGSGYTELAVRLLGSAQNSIANRAEEGLRESKLSAVTASVSNIVMYPNPSRSAFAIVVKSGDNNIISLRISDASGRLIEAISGVRTGETKQFGAGYMPGTYYVEIVQGNQHKTVKLVKL